MSVVLYACFFFLVCFVRGSLPSSTSFHFWARFGLPGRTSILSVFVVFFFFRL